MSECYVTRHELEQLEKRFESNSDAQDKRIDGIETRLKNTTELTISVSKLATSMENMTTSMKAMSDEQAIMGERLTALEERDETKCKNQEKQDERLLALENRDGEMWRSTVKYIITAIIGIIIGFVATQIGL